MKTLSLIFFIAFSFLAHLENKTLSESKPSSLARDIELKGSLATAEYSIFSNQIIANVNYNNINVNYNVNCNKIYVYIYNCDGNIVYSKLKSIRRGDSENISLKNYNKGQYKIQFFQYKTNRSIEGYFNLE